MFAVPAREILVFWVYATVKRNAPMETSFQANKRENAKAIFLVIL